MGIGRPENGSTGNTPNPAGWYAGAGFMAIRLRGLGVLLPILWGEGDATTLNPANSEADRTRADCDRYGGSFRATPSLSAILINSASDRAPIFRMICPR